MLATAPLGSLSKGRKKKVNALDIRITERSQLGAMRNFVVRAEFESGTQLITNLKSAVSPRHSQMVSELVLVWNTFFIGL